MIDNQTANFAFPLPHQDNYLEIDVERLRQALEAIDAALISEDILRGNSIGDTVQAFTPPASESEAEEGTEAEVRGFSPLRVTEAQQAYAPDASLAEMDEGTETERRSVSPAHIKRAINTLAVPFYSFADRALLRTNEGDDYVYVAVDGLGLFRWVAGSTEPDDGQTCFATTTGRWLLEGTHTDLSFEMTRQASLEMDRRAAAAEARIAVLEERLSEVENQPLATVFFRTFRVMEEVGDHEFQVHCPGAKTGAFAVVYTPGSTDGLIIVGQSFLDDQVTLRRRPPGTSLISGYYDMIVINGPKL